MVCIFYERLMIDNESIIWEVDARKIRQRIRQQADFSQSF
jgi:hypothetical protein